MQTQHGWDGVGERKWESTCRCPVYADSSAAHTALLAACHLQATEDGQADACRPSGAVAVTHATRQHDAVSQAARHRDSAAVPLCPGCACETVA